MDTEKVMDQQLPELLAQPTQEETIVTSEKEPSCPDVLMDRTIMQGLALSAIKLGQVSAGGAETAYSIQDRRTEPHSVLTVLNFQNGPVNEGINGLTNELLLDILIDRLTSFQAGPYPCDENKFALAACKKALWWLIKRGKARINRGVQGTMVK